MDYKAHQILTDAFNRRAVYGLFFHTADMYFDPEEPSSHLVSSLLLQNFRRLEIPCIHVLDASDKETVLSTKQVKKLSENQRPYVGLMPIKGEKTFSYFANDGLKGKLTKTYLRSLAESPTFICVGFNAHDCYQRSVKSTVKKISNSNVFTITDGTNKRVSAEEFMTALKEKMKPHESMRLHEATAAEAISTIDLARDDLA